MKSNSSSLFFLSPVFFFSSCFLPSPLSSSLFFIYFLWQCHTGKHFLSLSLQPVRYWETKSVTFSPVSVILGSKFQSLCLQSVWYQETKSHHSLQSVWYWETNPVTFSPVSVIQENKILSLSLQSVWYWETNPVTFSPVIQRNKKQNPVTFSPVSVILENKSCHFHSGWCDAGKQNPATFSLVHVILENKILSLSLQSVWYWETDPVTFCWPSVPFLDQNPPSS